MSSKDTDRSDAPMILVVDDGGELHSAISRLLQGTGYRTLFAEDSPTAVSIAEKYQPHVIVLDAEMAMIDAFELCNELKSRLHTTDIPIIFINEGEASEEIISKCFGAGGRDLISKPLNKVNLVSRLKVALREQSLREAYRQLAIQDHFTKLVNRRQSILEIQAMIATTRREHDECVLILGDLDDCAIINEKYGHDFCDEVILTFSRLIRRFVSSDCRAGRLNGDTFCIALRNCSRQRGIAMAERVGSTFAAVAFDAAKSPKHFTASFGVAHYACEPPDFDADTMLSEADVALFAAKGTARGTIKPYWTLDPDSLPIVTPEKRNARKKMRNRTNHTYVGVDAKGVEAKAVEAPTDTAAPR